MNLLIEAAKAIEGYTSDIAEKLRQKEEKYPPRPAATAAAAAAATNDADVMDIAPFAPKPFLESAVVFGRDVAFKQEMQFRARDIPIIEHYVRTNCARAFEYWVIFRRGLNDRAKGTKRSFEEFKYILDGIVSDTPLFANSPSKFSFVLDLIECAFAHLKKCAAEEQKLQPPREPFVPSITAMQQALLRAGLDTTFETTLVDVAVDDIVDIGLFRPNFQPMAIFKGKPGPEGVLERLALDIARRKRALANSNIGNDRPAKRHAPG